MIKTIFTIFHDFIDRLLVLIDIVRNRTSQIRARRVFFCQNFVTECNQGSKVRRYERKQPSCNIPFSVSKKIWVNWGQVLIEVKGHVKDFQTSYSYQMR